MLSFDGSRYAMEDSMRDLMRADGVLEERGMCGEEVNVAREDEVLVPLPLRPSVRARVSSPARAKKTLAASLDSLAVPCRGSAALLKENIAVGSPVANLSGDSGPKCLSRHFDLASENGLVPFRLREVVGNIGSVTCPQLVSSPRAIYAVSAPAKCREPEPCPIPAQLRTSEAIMRDDRTSASGEQLSFSSLTAQDAPQPLIPAPHVLQSPTLAATTPSTGKRWKDNGTLRLKKNLRVWCLSSKNNWVSATVISPEETEALVRTSDQEVIRVNAIRLQPANPDILEGVHDLIKLSYLNEPSVLHNLEFRYAHDKIYTRAGPVLIAVNPFKKVPIYGPHNVQAYQRRTPESSHPHVYMTADSAFKAMVQGGMNQSVIISGESGAGKTETAKIAMQYLASLGGGGGLEVEILQTNPILEAFGNAKTLRNDNSSRFGKLIDIHFDKVGKICGAKIQTYLLEKSRVVQQGEGERSYHVFYQLCAGADYDLQERFHLRSAGEYRYLNQSNCLSIDNVDDAEDFQLLRSAMNVVQISKEDQEHSFEMLSAVLWLGNINFCIVEHDNHVVVEENEGNFSIKHKLHIKL